MFAYHDELRLFQMVTEASAGFFGSTAVKILNVDHHEVCKFENMYGGYMEVLKRLKGIREALLLRGIVHDDTHNVP